MFTVTTTRCQRALWTRRELQAGLTISVVGQQPGGADGSWASDFDSPVSPPDNTD